MVHPQSLYRVHRPAAAIVTLLLASGDIESNPGPVQYPVLYAKNILRGTNMALCVMAVVIGHTLIVAVWERLNICCLPLNKVVNGFAHYQYSQFLA